MDDKVTARKPVGAPCTEYLTLRDSLLIHFPERILILVRLEGVQCHVPAGSVRVRVRVSVCVSVPVVLGFGYEFGFEFGLPRRTVCELLDLASPTFSRRHLKGLDFASYLPSTFHTSHGKAAWLCRS